MSERMLFCLGKGRYETTGDGYQKNDCIFNVQVTPEEWDTAKKSLPEIKIQLTKWIDKKDMTAEDKKTHTSYSEVGGCLKRFTYEEAWATWWAENPKSHVAIHNLPNFNAEIFKGITGIDEVAVKEPEPTKSKEIIVDGITYVPKLNGGN